MPIYILRYLSIYKKPFLIQEFVSWSQNEHFLHETFTIPFVTTCRVLSGS